MPEKDFGLVTNGKINLVDCQVAKFGLGEQTSLLVKINSLGPDLVHFTMPVIPLAMNKKFVATIHDLTKTKHYFPDQGPRQAIYDFMISSVARRAERIITPTNWVKDDVTTHYTVEPEKIDVTYESATPITDKPEPIQEVEGKKFFFYIGRINSHKNIQLILEAWRQMPEDTFMVMAGGFDRNELRKFGHLSPKILTPGYISEGQKRWAYENAQAYILPALSEGFGLPGLEAMADSCPVLSSSATCLPEVYGDAAIYFDPNSSHDLLAKINSLNHALRMDMIQKGRQKVKEYSWTKMARETTRTYKKALSPR